MGESTSGRNAKTPRRSQLRLSAIISAAVSISLGATLAAGCASLPTAGEPQPFNPVSSNTDPIEQEGTGPWEDSSPQRLVQDFLRASAVGASNDYMTAREYLLPNAAAKWHPEAAVYIYGNSQGTTVQANDAPDSDQTTVVVQVSLTASVDEAGILTHTESGSRNFSFSLALNADGQWRIAELEDGVILSESYFVSAYQYAQLYFLAPDHRSLVPDPRWFPRSRLVSHLVKGLLGGPSETLAPAVYSAFDDSLQLSTKGVEVEGKTVAISLFGDSTGGLVTRQNMLWQLTSTLDQIVSITDVKLEINQVEFDHIEIPTGPKYELDAALGIRGGSVVRGAGDGWIQFVGPTIAGEDVRFPARSPVADPTLAWLNGQVELAILAPGEEVVRVETAGATAPSVDRWGYVWTAGPERGQITVFEADGTSQILNLSDMPDATVKKISVSPDGLRLLAILEPHQGTALREIVIDREFTGRPKGLSTSNPINPDFVDVIDASWAGSTTVVALTQTDDITRVTTADLGGFSGSVGVPEPVVRITAGATVSRIYLQAEGGQLYGRIGSVWRQLGSEVSDVSFPG